MLRENGTHPGAVKDAVCSPGGSTIAGVYALETGAFRADVMNAVRAAFEKTRQLGK
ncbi:MAG: pyrroline-5-carboxylate reductase dimerization domain-containing protein [Eubacteriales bacterium]|nr:pyrroline-5-carboxylate reductase dimerization domain-containing protein [Eubacteriales bacterium]